MEAMRVTPTVPRVGQLTLVQAIKVRELSDLYTPPTGLGQEETWKGDGTRKGGEGDVEER